MTLVEKMVKLAYLQVGVKEYPPNSSNVQYNTAYYGGTVNNPSLHWCAVFIWWLFKICDASSLYYGGRKTASCTTLSNYHKKELIPKQKARPGDIVFFDFSGRGKITEHVGICVKPPGCEMITTIDGNTGGKEADGGAVMVKTRNLKYVSKVWRPNYQSLEEKEMPSIPFKYVQDCPEWAQEALSKAIRKLAVNEEDHIINLNSDGSMNVYPENFQVIVWLDRLGLLD